MAKEKKYAMPTVIQTGILGICGKVVDYTNIGLLLFNALKDSSYIVTKMDSKQEIISRLKFIGKLKKGEKINTRHIYVQPSGIGTTLSRTFLYPDNRGNALNFVNETISRAFEILLTYSRTEKDSEKILLNNLVNDLNQTTMGLNNLKFTYIDDSKFCCDIEALLESVQASLRLYRKEEDESDFQEESGEST